MLVGQPLNRYKPDQLLGDLLERTKAAVDVTCFSSMTPTVLAQFWLKTAPDFRYSHTEIH